jgi:hypothetical protein
MSNSNVNVHELQCKNISFSEDFQFSNRNSNNNRMKQTQTKSQLIMRTRISVAFFLIVTTLFHVVHASDSLSSTTLTLFPITGTTVLKPSEQEDFSSSEFIIDNDSNDVTNTKSDDSITLLPENTLVPNPRIDIPEDSHVEFTGHTIGDSHRSSKSSQSFFASVDLDGDGQILKPELSYFLSQMIGGSAFDDDKEIEDEVGSIMDKMDLEGDGKLEMGDVNSYWEKLESLLTVDEVAEWIVHAGQLPMEVGNIFRKNHVTGYDFPELVEDNGSALKNELNIDKSTYRKKIVRAVNSRLFGIGTVPYQVDGVIPTIESCSTITLKWNKARTDNLPVHKYRVTRRAIGGSNMKSQMGIHVNQYTSSGRINSPSSSNFMKDGKENVHDLDLDIFQSEALVNAPSKAVSESSEETCELPNATFDFDSITQSISEWTTVYDGSETECVDSGLERGQGYVYRIQAWNLVGKSPWTVVDLSQQWFEKGCYLDQEAKKEPSLSKGTSIPKKSSEGSNTPDTATESEKQTKSTIFRKMYRLITSWGSVIINICMTLAAISTAMMRLRRATVTSTATNLEPLIPWLFRNIDSFLKEHIGTSVIPQSFMMESHERLLHHDNVVKSVGLNGYIASTPSTSERAIIDRNKHLRDLRQFKSEPSLNVKLDTPLGNGSNDKPNKKSRPFSRIRSPQVVIEKKESSIQMSQPVIAECDAIVSGPLEDNKKNTIAAERVDTNATSKRGRLFRISHSLRDEIKEPALSENVISRADAVLKSVGSQDQDSKRVLSERSNVDDHNICNSCYKRCKFPKRCRHHCSKCGSTFCHKHGRTTHSNLVTCKVPGDCICNVCLGEM